jgi:hypothetical protein
MIARTSAPPTARLVGGLLLCLALLAPGVAQARDVFINTVSAANSPTQVGETHAIDDVFGMFDADTLSELFGPTYSDTDAVMSHIDLRGVDLELSFADGSTELVISMPQVGESWTIDTGLPLSRDQQLDLVKAWLAGEIELPADGGDVSLTPILQAFLEYSPVDPVAGNPNSLQSKMLDADYLIAGSGPFVDVDPDTGKYEAVDNWLRAEADFSYFNAEGIRGESYDIGISYGLNLPGNRLALLFDLPFALTRAGGGGLSYMGSAALGLQVRVKPWWNVTPIFRTGLSGSFDLGALAVLYSGNVVSNMKWKIKGFDVTMGNLVGVESNIDRVKYQGIPVEYDMLVGVFENGLTIGKPIRTRIFGKRLRWQAFYRLSSFVGMDLFLNNQHATGLRYSSGGHADGQSLEVGWAGGKDYDSLRIRFVAKF